jgi:hypothetical protein
MNEKDWSKVSPEPLQQAVFNPNAYQSPPPSYMEAIQPRMQMEFPTPPIYNMDTIPEGIY